jgi:hypothetical protein
MRPPILALATVLLAPAAALAQPLDLAEDAEPPALETPMLETPVLETDDAVQSGEARLGDLEDQVTDAPLVLEPKFDLTDDQPDGLSAPSALDHTEPEPAPGVRLKIPTN